MKSDLSLGIAGMLLFNTTTLATGGDVMQKNQLSLERKLNSDVELFDGEVLIKENGLYTKVHTYKHPKKNLEVVLVGDNHGGTKGYLERMKPYLNQCDLILHEKFFEGKEDAYKPTADYIMQVFDYDSRGAFMLSLQAFFKKFSEINGITLSTEDNMVDKGLEHKWLPVDYASTKRNAEKTMKNLLKNLNKIDDKKKREIVEYVVGKIKRIDSGDLKLKEFGEVYVKLYQDKEILNVIMSSSLIKDRDSYLFKELQKIIDSRENIKKIGIFYGAGHMPGLKKLLEKNSYQHIKTENILAMEF